METYSDALRYLLSLTQRGVQPGLERIERALEFMGHPERNLPVVVVGGTNGKGSISSFVAQAAAQQGWRVGLFTSPHLHRLTERIRVNGREVSRRELTAALRSVRRAVEVPGGPRLTFFEMVTLVAAELFRARQVDLAVLEVGLGGRLDATRAFPAQVVVLCNVALDHQGYLGNTVEAIAREKFALVQPGSVVVAGQLPETVQPLLREQLEACSAPCWWPGQDYHWTSSSPTRLSYRSHRRCIDDLPLRLRGAHQQHNLAVALAAVDALADQGWAVDDQAVRRAAGRLRWPGRMEPLRQGRVIVDVAHNPAGIRALVEALPELARGRRPIVGVLGCMKDKDAPALAATLAEVTDQLLVAAPAMDRALEPGAFQQWVDCHVMPSVPQAVEEACNRAGEQGVVVVAGSTFVAAEARAHVLGLTKVDPSIPM
jgi:dihydrofolate synthase/folylpolyglutamate synthase